MTKFSYIYLVWISVCVDLLSAEPEISVSGPVGSTAVLPCQLTSVDTERLYIRWNTESEIVFERLNERSYQGEGYEGRVDVPVEELRKGNCSLVLHNLTLTDTGVYTSYQTVRHTKRSVRVRRGTVLINSVKLSVYVPPLKETDVGISAAPTGSKVMGHLSDAQCKGQLWLFLSYLMTD
ncbi:CD276 antigen homolog [Clarias gariepinus]|uniref:CD276 antigen homolog n=1 Tax=Clarias gariepinus TaxID=13013 RepID=UPI00234D8D5C|nr:CD276 antigen homolog [Clarias gariepinus]